MNNKVLMVIAPKDFRDEEYLIPKKIFEDNGLRVVTASKNAGMCLGSIEAKVQAQKTIDEIVESDYDALVLIGGTGARVYFDDNVLKKIILNFYNKGKIIGAICIAPAILAKAGILGGKKATIFSQHSQYLKQGGAIYTKSHVEVCKNIITADGPTSACEFAKNITGKINKD